MSVTPSPVFLLNFMMITLNLNPGLGVALKFQSSLDVVSKFGHLLATPITPAIKCYAALKGVAKTAVVTTAVIGVGYLAYSTYVEAVDARALAVTVGNGYVEEDDRRQERAGRNADRRARRLYTQWMKIQGFEEPSDHPFVYRLFAEMGDHPANRDYYAIAHRRLRRWFDELVKVDVLIKDMVARKFGPEPVDDAEEVDVVDNPQDINVEPLTARQVWYEQVRRETELLRDYFEDNPVEFVSNFALAGTLVKPPDRIMYRTACVIVEAALAMRARDVNESQYFLGREDIVAASRAGPDLRPRGGLAPWAAGLVNWRDAIWSRISLPGPK